MPCPRFFLALAPAFPPCYSLGRQSGRPSPGTGFRVAGSCPEAKSHRRESDLPASSSKPLARQDVWPWLGRVPWDPARTPGRPVRCQALPEPLLHSLGPITAGDVDTLGNRLLLAGDSRCILAARDSVQEILGLPLLTPEATVQPNLPNPLGSAKLHSDSFRTPTVQLNGSRVSYLRQQRRRRHPGSAHSL